MIPAGDAATAAHLLEFDSVHGRWDRGITSSADGFSLEGSALTWSSESDPTAVPWSDRGVDGNQLKVFAWYDNEWGYSCRMADLACHVVGLEA